MLRTLLSKPAHLQRCALSELQRTQFYVPVLAVLHANGWSSRPALPSELFFTAVLSFSLAGFIRYTHLAISVAVTAHTLLRFNHKHTPLFRPLPDQALHGGDPNKPGVEECSIRTGARINPDGWRNARPRWKVYAAEIH